MGINSSGLTTDITVINLQGSLVIIVQDNLVPEFSELIQQGSNLSPNISPAMKEFADLVTVGHVQQDYHAQAKSPSQ